MTRELHPEDASPDHEERIQDFFARHGGPAARPDKISGAASSPEAGWSEIHAADGYRLRTEWSRFGSREAMNYTEIPPAPPV